MRRLLAGFVLALSLGFLIGSRPESSSPAPVVVERARIEPRMAVAIPAALRRHAELEFGYVERDR